MHRIRSVLRVQTKRLARVWRSVLCSFSLPWKSGGVRHSILPFLLLILLIAYPLRILFLDTTARDVWIWLQDLDPAIAITLALVGPFVVLCFLAWVVSVLFSNRPMLVRLMETRVLTALVVVWRRLRRVLFTRSSPEDYSSSKTRQHTMESDT